MGAEIPGRMADSALGILDAMRQWVAEPLERQMASLETQIRDQQVQTREQLAAMREDFRAALTAMSDPQTGYVPRSEINLLMDGMKQTINSFIASVNEQREQDSKREAERIRGTRWLIGITLGVATVIATLISAFSPLVHHP